MKWGILGCGGIARSFADDLRHCDNAELVAVAARDGERAAAFAREFGADRSHAGYEALAADAEVEAVYVATTHNFHCEHALLLLHAGKHVLCEKPLATTAAEVVAMADTARKRGVFLMEAMWTWFLPAVRAAKDAIARGSIGRVRRLTVDFSFHRALPLDHRIRNPDLAGGALYDLGIYPLSFASAIFDDAPQELVGYAQLDPETGVDAHCAMLASYRGGAQALMSCSYTAVGSKSARIDGADATIEVPFFWRADEAYLLTDEGRVREALPFEHIGRGYHYQVAHMQECVAQGLAESPILPHAISLRHAQLIDDLLGRWLSQPNRPAASP